MKAVLTPKTEFTKGNAPENEKFTIGEGIPPTELGAEHFGGLKIDGDDTFSVTDGSLVINFKQAYLNSLSVGTHTIEATLTGTYAGTYTTTVRVLAAGSNSPQTGDSSSLLMWISLIALAEAGITTSLIKKRKHNL